MAQNHWDKIGCTHVVANVNNAPNDPNNIKLLNWYKNRGFFTYMINPKKTTETIPHYFELKIAQ